jgi:hypothetical protein
MAFDSRLLTGIEVLAAVVEAGSFVRAAESLGLTQSGVSRAIARLGAIFPRCPAAARDQSADLRRSSLSRKARSPDRTRTSSATRGTSAFTSSNPAPAGRTRGSSTAGDKKSRSRCQAASP